MPSVWYALPSVYRHSRDRATESTLYYRYAFPSVYRRALKVCGTRPYYPVAPAPALAPAPSPTPNLPPTPIKVWRRSRSTERGSCSCDVDSPGCVKVGCNKTDFYQSEPYNKSEPYNILRAD